MLCASRQPEQTRRAYREMLFAFPGAAEFISGMILQDEKIRQQSAAGVPMAQVLSRQGIMPGIKVDTGARPLAGCPGETVTDGRARRVARPARRVPRVWEHALQNGEP